jgi:hypothetical protein
MKQCPACKESAQNDATKCPHCGEPLAPKPPMSKRNVILLVVGVCLALTGLFVDHLVSPHYGRQSFVRQLLVVTGTK